MKNKIIFGLLLFVSSYNTILTIESIASSADNQETRTECIICSKEINPPEKNIICSCQNSITFHAECLKSDRIEHLDENDVIITCSQCQKEIVTTIENVKSDEDKAKIYATFVVTKKEKEFPEKVQCSICLEERTKEEEENDNNPFVSMKCNGNHWFHEQCIGQAVNHYMLTSTSENFAFPCPLCREDLFKKESPKIETTFYSSQNIAKIALVGTLLGIITYKFLNK